MDGHSCWIGGGKLWLKSMKLFLSFGRVTMANWQNKYKMKEVEIVVDERKKSQYGFAAGFLIAAGVWIVVGIVWGMAG